MRERRNQKDRRGGADRRKLDRRNQDRRQYQRRENDRKNNKEEQEERRFDDQIEGRNSVLELLESGKDINKIFVTRGEKHGSIMKILAIAKEKVITTSENCIRVLNGYNGKEIWSEEGKYTGLRYVHAIANVEAKIWYSKKEKFYFSP